MFPRAKYQLYIVFRHVWLCTNGERFIYDYCLQARILGNYCEAQLWSKSNSFLATWSNLTRYLSFEVYLMESFRHGSSLCPSKIAEGVNLVNEVSYKTGRKLRRVTIHSNADILARPKIVVSDIPLLLGKINFRRVLR